MSEKNTNQDKPVYNRSTPLQPSSSTTDLRRLSSLNAKKEKKFVPKIGANKKKQKVKIEAEDPAFIKRQKQKQGKKSLKITGNRRPFKTPIQKVQQKAVFEAKSKTNSKRSHFVGGSSSRKPTSSFARDIKTKCEVEYKSYGDEEANVNDLIREIEETQFVSEEETEPEADLAPLDYAECLMDEKGESLIEHNDLAGCDVGKILREHKNSNKLLYIQMPDKLPMKPVGMSLRERDDEAETNATDKNPEDTKKSVDQIEFEKQLEKMGEGYVGKIQVMRNGKAKLVIGNVEFNITGGLHEPCYQEAVSVVCPTKENGNVGSVTHLGSFDRALTITQDLDQQDVLAQY